MEYRYEPQGVCSQEMIIEVCSHVNIFLMVKKMIMPNGKGNASGIQEE